MKLAGIIFADSGDAEYSVLIKHRTLAGLPFGARYRMIDFALSNMVNSGIGNVGIVVVNNYQSLIKHVRAGEEWDLDRKHTSVTVLPPYADNSSGTEMYRNRLEGLQANLTYIANYITEDYILVMGCDYVSNTDYSKMLDYHVKSGALLTVLCKQDPEEKIQAVDDSGGDKEDPEGRGDRHQGERLTAMLVARRKPGAIVNSVTVDRDGMIDRMEVGAKPKKGYLTSMNTYILSRKDLVKILLHADAARFRSLRRDVFPSLVAEKKAAAYIMPDLALGVNNVSDYLRSNLALLHGDVRRQLFESENGQIITRVKDSPPTRYGSHAEVSNSLIADGAIIDGRVKNSVIFRGVHVGEGAVIENSVVMQDSVISSGVRLNYCILDRLVTIEPGRALSGYLTHPFLVEKDTRI